MKHLKWLGSPFVVLSIVIAGLGRTAWAQVRFASYKVPPQHGKMEWGRALLPAWTG